MKIKILFLCVEIYKKQKKLISAYYKEMGNLIRNVETIADARKFSFQTADMYFQKDEMIEEY